MGINAMYLKKVLQLIRVLVMAKAYKKPKVTLKTVEHSEMSMVFATDALKVGVLKYFT